MRIEGCKRESTEAPIHISSVQDTVLDDIEFYRNKNTQGPCCLSGTNSTLILQHISASDNSGLNAGFLNFILSAVTLLESTFQRNVKDGKYGAILAVTKSKLIVKDTGFMENVPLAISLMVGCTPVQEYAASNFLSKSVLSNTYVEITSIECLKVSFLSPIAVV